MPAYIFKALIGFASKVAPPAALPLSCCTATSVSGRVSLGGALSWRARLRLRSLIGARGRLPLLLQLRRCWLTGGSRAPDQPGVRGGLVAARPPRARGPVCCDGSSGSGSGCPAVRMNCDRGPQLLSPSPLLKAARP